MKTILAENMLRFGVKNLTESNVNNILQLLAEQNEDLTDWSQGGKYTWENAKDFGLIIKFVQEVDAKSGGAFLQMEEYKAMMAWFAKNDSKETRASLKAWVFDNIVFGGAKQPELNKKDLKKDPTLGQDLGTISQALTNLEQIITDPQLYSDTNISNNLKKYIQRLQQEIKAYNAKGLSFTDSVDVREFIKELMLIGSDVKIVINKIKNSSNTNVKLDKAGDSFWETAQYYSSVKEILKYFAEMFSDKEYAGLASKLSIDTDNDDIKVDITKSGANLSQIKTNVISSLRKSVIDAQGQKALSNFSKAIMAAKSISITNQMSEIKAGWSEYTEITKEATMSDVSSPIFCYPPLNIPEGEQRSAMGQSMFADNSISVSSQAETALNAQIQAAAAFIQEYQQKVESIKAQVNTDVPDMEIISFQYAAYSSTSTVNTKYGKSKRSNKANNIPLATDRYNAMIAKMKELIENNDTLNEFEVEGPSEQFIYPNIGPEWMSVGGKLQDGTQLTIKNYGPLFQQAYARDPKITPQRFYGLRSTPQLKQEYESVYAKYRQSTCAFTIQLRIPELLAKQEVIQDFLVGGTPEMLINVDFPAGVDWTGMKRKFKRGVRKIGTGIKKMGGGSRSGGAPMPVFKGRSTGCPSWG